MAFSHLLGMTILISHPQSPPLADQFSLYARTGFDSVFIGSGTIESPELLPSLSDCATGKGIRIEAFHASSDKADALWCRDDRAAETALRRYCEAVDACGAAKIGKLVMHTACSPETEVTEEGLGRFADLEAYARARNVVLCYENGNVLPTLAAVLQNASAPHGYCYDAGHQLCYSPDVPLEKIFGNQMIYTHLHDNDGKGDKHFLPFDGVRDWKALAKALADADYRGTLNLELACHSSPAYREMPFAVFVQRAYARLTRFAAMVEGLPAESSE